MRSILAMCFIILITAGSANAQHSNTGSIIKDNMAAFQQSIFANQFAPLAQQKTTAAKRLTGHSRYESGIVTDSTHHSYRPSQRSTHPNEDSYFSTMYQTISYFDAANALSMQYIQSDTSVTLKYSGSGLKLFNTVISDYDGKGQLTKQMYITKDDMHEDVITNNTNGQRLTVMVRDTTNGTPLSDKEKHYFIYDNLNRIILDSSVYIPVGNQPYYKAVYTYNAAGLLASWYSQYGSGASTFYQIKLDFVYDGSNRLLVQTASQYNGTNWDLNARDTFSYTGTAAHYTYSERQSWDAGTGKWYTGSSDYTNFYELDNGGFVKKEINCHKNIVKTDTLFRNEFFINANSLYDSVWVSDYLGGSFRTPSVQLHFYYQDVPTSTIAQVEQHDLLKVYPNPSTGIYTINTARSIEAINITDINGKVVYSQKAAGSQTVIDLRHLANGTYFLKASGNNTVQGMQIIKY